MKLSHLGARIAAAIALMFVAAAAQADPPADQWNRAGPYAGIIGGYDAAEMKAEDFKFNDGKMLAGAFVGFNYRVPGGPVVGLEGDYMVSNVKATRTDESISITASSRYLASIRGRVGAPLGPMLLYATGGVAFTDHKLSASDGEESASDRKMLIGGVGGLGIEAELTKSVFVRVEGLHYWFPDKGMSFADEDVFKSGSHQTVGRIGFGVKF